MDKHPSCVITVLIVDHLGPNTLLCNTMTIYVFYCLFSFSLKMYFSVGLLGEIALTITFFDYHVLPSFVQRLAKDIIHLELYQCFFLGKNKTKFQS